MKIIIFDGSFKTTAFINRLIEGLAKSHQVYVLGFNEGLNAKIIGVQYVKLGSNLSKLAFIKTSLHLAWRAYSIKTGFSTLMNLLKFNRKALQYQNFNLAVKKIDPDIIHAQWVSNLPILEQILSEKRYPVVFSQRGYHINVRPFVDTENFNYLKEWFPKILGFHSVSKAISRKGDLIYNDPSKIDHVVYSGLDLSEIHYKTNYIKGSKLTFISVGRAHWIKGYEYALSACALLKARGIEFSYCIIGAGQDEELIYLRQFYNLNHEVEFLDSLPQFEVFEAITNADVMLLPSIEEGIANVAIEAMALGTLVISTNCGGMQELIEDKKEGWIVSMRNPEAMVKALMDFDIQSDQTLEDMRLKARKKVEEQFAEKNMLQGMERLYKACLNEKN